MGKILVIGSSNTDMVVKTPNFPRPGETIIGGEFFMFPGGKGANQAVAAARAGGDVQFITKIGNDIFGQNAFAGFEEEGIETRFVLQDSSAASGVALITVNNEGENQIVVASGANSKLTPANIDYCREAFDQADLLLLQLEIPLETVTTSIVRAADSGKKVILNPAPAQTLPDDVFPRLYLITPNETEAELLTGIEVVSTEDAEKAARVLLDKGVGNVIITLGSRGAYFQNREEVIHIPAPKVKAVDTTCAGDIFNGVLAVSLSNGSNWPDAIKMAVSAASISVTRMGAQSSAPYKHELTSS